jgi:hypothetical protein
MDSIDSLNKKVQIAAKVIAERGLLFISMFIINMYINSFLINLNHAYSYVYANILKRPLIHVIGDSHSFSFKRRRRFIIHYIGPATAYNLANKNGTVKSNEKLFKIIHQINKQRDIIVLVFGEIDCRVHIYNQFKKNNEAVKMTSIIDNAITNYGIILRQLKDMGINFCVYGILPASKGIIRYPPYMTSTMREAEFKNFKEKYPYLADQIIRSQINKEFNERLKRYCREHDYKYIDIYPYVASKEGIILDEFAQDEIHVNGNIMSFIKGWFNDNYQLGL